MAAGERTIRFAIGGRIVLQSTIVPAFGGFILDGRDKVIILESANTSVRPLIQLLAGPGRIKNVRFRLMRRAALDQRDNLTIRGGSDLVLSHCSFELATDENLGINPAVGFAASRIEISYCIIALALMPHSTGLLMVSAPDSPLRDIVIHHCLFAHNASRNPTGNGQHLRIINNIVYNWRNEVGRIAGEADIDYIGNIFVAGPWTANSRAQYDIVSHVDERISPSIHAAGNFAYPLMVDFPQASQWDMFRSRPSGARLPSAWQRDASIGGLTFAPDSYRQAYDDVLRDVGAQPLDRLDQWIIHTVLSRTGPDSDAQMAHQDTIMAMVNTEGELLSPPARGFRQPFPSHAGFVSGGLSTRQPRTLYSDWRLPH